MKKFFLIFGISILFLFFWIGKSYNNLVKLNEEVKVQWAQVENSFQRRADLIPNLVNIVKGVSNFEKNTLIKIVEARSKATSLNIDANILKQEQIDNFQKIQNNLSNKLSRLLISIEKYPNLKSTQNFSDFQSQIEGTENRISIERNRFNKKVNFFNIYRCKFPNFLIANFFSKFNEKGYFKSNIFNEKPPIINFENYFIFPYIIL